MTVPVPEGWFRDGPARDQRGRFIDEISRGWAESGGTAEAAWSLIMDAWRVIEVASARGDCPARPAREEWFAALEVAIFRAGHPEATSTALDD